MIGSISESLYADSPDELLYHYTTIKGFQGIIDNGYLWASDVRYMNDSAELQYIVQLLRWKIEPNEKNALLLNQFADWIANRITNGHMVFAASFRANGNLLSQWRGYSRVGKGISIGFKGVDIKALAQHSEFKLGRCIYQREQQELLIDRVISSLLSMSQSFDLESDHSREAFFKSIEVDILRVAVLLKHPSFAEEDEWRIVSPVVTDYLSAPVKFREGTSMLIPYYEFPLIKNSGVPVEHLFVGPTPNSTLSLNSLRLYLRKKNILLGKEITYCDIPYRNR
ncbi:MAG: DUF2971 domain-containing protein [Cellvibrionaceae bacterium]